MAEQWTKKWSVGNWTVALNVKGFYGCSCPAWKFQRLPFPERKDCHHILQVKANGGDELEAKPRPAPVLAMVNKPIYKEETNELLLPLIKIPDAEMMEATVCFYLLKHGYSWTETKELRQHIPYSWTAKAVIAHVERYGEACYKDDRSMRFIKLKYL